MFILQRPIIFTSAFIYEVTNIKGKMISEIFQILYKNLRTHSDCGQRRQPTPQSYLVKKYCGSC